jgi:hypothetical protein
MTPDSIRARIQAAYTLQDARGWFASHDFNFNGLVLTVFQQAAHAVTWPTAGAAEANRAAWEAATGLSLRVVGPEHYAELDRMEAALRAAAVIPAKPEGINLDTPNLDACDDEELRDWRRAFATLAEIANHLQTARYLRLRGAIEAAREREQWIDAAIATLPAGVRW